MPAQRKGPAARGAQRPKRPAANRRRASPAEEPATDVAAPAPADLTAELARYAEQASTLLARLAEDAGRSGQQAVRAIEETVGSRPLLALGASFALGVLVSRLLDRR